MGGAFSTLHIIPNLRNYAGWLIGSQSALPLIGFVALLLPVRRLWPATEHRWVTVLLGGAVVALVAYYSTYLVFDAWWHLRFLLPAWPLLLLGLAAIGAAATNARGPWLTAVIVIGMVLLGVTGLRTASDRFVFDLWRGERRYVAAAQGARAITPPNSVLFAVLHSGSARYYAGRLTLRFDELDPAWLDRSVMWLRDRGVSSYLLADDLEMDQVRARFAGQATLARLDASPLFTYSGSQKVFLYRLDAGAGDGPGTTVVETWRGPRVVLPAPSPTLIFAPH